jgi:hypothetical protein
MFVVVQHTLTDPPTALARGQRLQRSEGAPQGTRVLQFLPSQDGSLVTCLWESDSVADVQSSSTRPWATRASTCATPSKPLSLSPRHRRDSPSDQPPSPRSSATSRTNDKGPAVPALCGVYPRKSEWPLGRPLKRGKNWGGLGYPGFR